MRARFRSLGRSHEVGYDLESENRYEKLYGRPLGFWAKEWPTLGDGFTQHAPGQCVHAEHIVDFCASLAAHLLEPRDPDEHDRLFDALTYLWPRQTERAPLEFAFSVRYNEDKRDRWFSMQERKISSAGSKRYDKRWEPIPEWADGSTTAVARLVMGNRTLLTLELYRLYEDAAAYVRSQTNWSEQASTLLALPDRVDAPFGAVSSILEAWQGLAWASRVVTGHIRNLREAQEDKIA